MVYDGISPVRDANKVLSPILFSSSFIIVILLMLFKSLVNSIDVHNFPRKHCGYSTVPARRFIIVC
jgi:hypothetical protein